MDKRTAVVAIGGNSLIKDRFHETVRDQYIAANETCRHIVTMISDGWRVAITHGNGPLITDPDNIECALAGQTGTRITP